MTTLRIVNSRSDNPVFFIVVAIPKNKYYILDACALLGDEGVFILSFGICITIIASKHPLTENLQLEFTYRCDWN